MPRSFRSFQSTTETSSARRRSSGVHPHHFHCAEFLLLHVPRSACPVLLRRRHALRSVHLFFPVCSARSIPHAANSGDVVKNGIPRPYACVCPPPPSAPKQ
ncbi:hypothetical protein TGFOU_304755 [Toxoplasma gondii FOU]|uniref:Uncharacterized protein n=1 Tax=Toxoplasma gondii FOU TaxID=943167 RepID=A0A086K1U7_TOXGO|nr:hypothetical protein TGFOU_304755 [Toxoplasma gondii FOU]